jgi:uncharacterized membrane protein
MNITHAQWISRLLVGATVIAALWAWFTLPSGAGIPVHYLGLDGRRHTEASRAILWLIPVVALIVLMALRLAARRGSVAPAAGAYDATLIGVTGVLLVAEAALIGRAAHPGFDVMGPVSTAVGVLLLVLGNVLGKARHNAAFGVRTPWTLADPRVWDKTHRFVGRGWVLGGLALIAIAFTLKNETALGLAIAACTALPALAGVAWSWRLAQRT